LYYFSFAGYAARKHCSRQRLRYQFEGELLSLRKYYAHSPLSHRFITAVWLRSSLITHTPFKENNMKTLHILLLALTFTATAALSSCAYAATPEDLSKDANQALAMLVKANPVAADISKKAKAVLIFPNIVKAGLIFGGAYGEGVLKQDGNVSGYYNSVTASFGWQAGAQSYGYVVFLMSDKAVKYIRETHGWEIGVGPTVVMVNEGVAKNLTSSTLKDDAYAFIFDQQGLMASLSIEGTKISRVNK
jgi:lipid-binding SYLF domain-containing protein